MAACQDYLGTFTKSHCLVPTPDQFNLFRSLRCCKTSPNELLLECFLPGLHTCSTLQASESNAAVCLAHPHDPTLPQLPRQVPADRWHGETVGQAHLEPGRDRLAVSAGASLWASLRLSFLILKRNRGFPGGAVVNNLPANAGDTGSSPGLGRCHMTRSN